MPGKRPIILLLSCLAATLAVSPTDAAELRGDLSVLGQVRAGDQSRATEAPIDLYGDVGLGGLPGRTRVDTYFRLGRDFALPDSATDFYAGYLRSQQALPGVDFTLGRQLLSEGPGGAVVADAGKIRIAPGGPLAVTVFGGQPRYFEPTVGAERLSQDEQIWGGSISTARWRKGQLRLGYLQLERAQKTLRQLVTGTVTRALSRWPGVPNLYGSFAYDADHQNLDLGSAGIDVFLSQPRLSFNVEGGYYKPQDQRSGRLITNMNRREDPIFELFSVSEMRQFRGGLRYALRPALSAYGNYSYQRYDQQPGTAANGHVGTAGVLWLPGGDGLEVVRLEYYVIDSAGGNINGGRLYYESRVYQRVLFRTKLDVAYYDKRTHERDTAVSSLLAIGYALTPALIGEIDFEANHNRRFDEEVRFGFLISYALRPRGTPPQRAQREAES